MSDYVTKSNLLSALSRFNANTTARDAKKTEVSNLDKRVSNLEQKAGDYSETRYQNAPRGVVPSSKASYGIWTTQRGVTRGWNQLVSNVIATTTISDVTFTNNGDGSLTISGTASADITNQAITTNITFPRNSHYTLCMINASRTITGVTYGVRGYDINKANNFMFYETDNSSWNNSLGINIANGTVVDVTIKPCVYDLTRMFGSDAPTTVSTALQRCPQLGQYNSHDAGSLVSNTISGLTSRGVAFENKTISSSGVEVSATNRVCTPYISVTPSSSVHMQLKGHDSLQEIYVVATYDSSKGFLGVHFKSSADTTMTLSSSVYYIRIVCRNTDESTTSPSDWLYKLYVDDEVYLGDTISTLSLPSPVTLRSAGSVQDTDELNVEVLVDGVKVNKRRRTTKIGTHIFSNDDTWGASTISGHEVYSLVISDCVAYVPVGADKLPTCAIYKPVVSNYLANLTDQSVMYMVDYMGIYVRDDSCADISALKAKLNGLSINYELATPVVTLSDPIEDNLIYTESGGTLTPVQTQTPTIDTDFSVGFLAI